MALMTLDIPLTASPCPIFVFTEPVSIGWPDSSLREFERASTSIGSPTGVPVPWAWKGKVCLSTPLSYSAWLLRHALGSPTYFYVDSLVGWQSRHRISLSNDCFLPRYAWESYTRRISIALWQNPSQFSRQNGVKQGSEIATYLFTAVPRMMECTGSAFFTESSSRFIYSAAIPSPLPYPSAEESNV